jgi:hypothetical protein
MKMVIILRAKSRVAIGIINYQQATQDVEQVVVVGLEVVAQEGVEQVVPLRREIGIHRGVKVIAIIILSASNYSRISPRESLVRILGVHVESILRLKKFFFILGLPKMNRDGMVKKCFLNFSESSVVIYQRLYL